jgi:general secretion pathway protein F
METFRYRAIDKSGETVHGEIAGADRNSVIARLQAQGLVPLAADQDRPSRFSGLLRRGLFGGERLSSRELADLFQQLAALVEAGVAVEQALSIAVQRDGAPRSRRVAEELRRRLRDGASLANAMRASASLFPPIAVVMVSTGEASGSLAAALSRLGEYLQRSDEIRQSIYSALIYPALLVVTVFLAVILILTVVIPQLEPLFNQSKAELPLATRMVLGASDALCNWWWAIALTLCALAVLLRRLLSDPAVARRRDRLMLRLPRIGAAVLRAEVARFTRTLGVLAWGRVPLPAALSLAGAVVSNAVVAAEVASALTQVREGSGLANALGRTAVFPEPSIQLIRIGEATGNLDTMLVRIADLFDRDVQRMVTRAMALLVPLLTIGLGIVVAGIIGSVMIALLSVNDLAS